MNRQGELELFYCHQKMHRNKNVFLNVCVIMMMNYTSWQLLYMVAETVGMWLASISVNVCKVYKLVRLVNIAAEGNITSLNIKYLYCS